MGEKFGLGRHKHNLDGHGGRGGKGFCIQLNCAGEGECQNRERNGKVGENSKGDWNGKGDLSSMALSVAEGKTKMLSTSSSVLDIA